MTERPYQLRLNIDRAIIVPSTANQAGEGPDAVVTFLAFTRHPRAIVSVRSTRRFIEQHCTEYDFFNPTHHEGREFSCNARLSFAQINSLTIPAYDCKLSVFVDEQVTFHDTVVPLEGEIQQFHNIIEGPIRRTRSTTATTGINILNFTSGESRFIAQTRQERSTYEDSSDSEE